MEGNPLPQFFGLTRPRIVPSSFPTCTPENTRSLAGTGDTYIMGKRWRTLWPGKDPNEWSNLADSKNIQTLKPKWHLSPRRIRSACNKLNAKKDLFAKDGSFQWIAGKEITKSQSLPPYDYLQDFCIKAKRKIFSSWSAMISTPMSQFRIQEHQYAQPDTTGQWVDHL